MRAYLSDPPDDANQVFAYLYERRIRHVRADVDLHALLETAQMMKSLKGKTLSDEQMQRFEQASVVRGTPEDPYEAIASSFTNPAGFRDSYHASNQRIVQCLLLLWWGAVQEEPAAEVHAELRAAIDDGLRLFHAYPRSHGLPHNQVNEHSLLLLVAAIMTGDGTLAKKIAREARLDPPANPKYPLHETMFDFLAGLFAGEREKAGALIPTLEKFKAGHLIRIPAPKLLRGVALGDAEVLHAGTREVAPRHEKLLARANLVVESTPKVFRYRGGFGGLQDIHKLPFLDLCCLRLAARAGLEVPVILHWYPAGLRDVPWQA